MAQFKKSLVFVGMRAHRRSITGVALAVAAMLTALPACAQRGNGVDLADGVSKQLLSARNKQHAGQYDAARAVLLGALAEVPSSALLLDALGSVEQDMGEYLEAERSYFRALAASTRTDDQERLVTLNNLGTLYLETGQYAKGDRVREQLEKVPPRTLEGYPAAAATLLNVVGSLEHARNRDDQAESYYARSLQFFQQAYGTVSIDAAIVKNNLGSLRLEAGQYESAADLFRQAITEIEVASSPENPAIVRPLLNLARCENMDGHPKQAEPLARRAAELSVRIFGEGHPVAAAAMLEEATALRHLGRKGLARPLEKRAKACLRINSAVNLTGYTVNMGDLARAKIRQ
jgi:tetratricopeptide (TPR) repeat protein